MELLQRVENGKIIYSYKAPMTVADLQDYEIFDFIPSVDGIYVKGGDFLLFRTENGMRATFRLYYTDTQHHTLHTYKIAEQRITPQGYIEYVYN